MAKSTVILTRRTTSYDEILSTSSPISSTSMSPVDAIISSDYDFTGFLLFLFPFYVNAIVWNFFTIYSILMAKIYRQYLSNVLFSMISIGALLAAHGQIFLTLIRWTNTSIGDQLCSTSFYLRDSGGILIHTHVFLLTCERIIANLKKQPNFLNNNVIQRAHLFLIGMSLINFILAFTVPIFTLKRAEFSGYAGLCLPEMMSAYKNYFNWIYFAFAFPFVILSLIFYISFFIRRTTISYSTLIPMNRLSLFLITITFINLVISILLDDILGVGDVRPIDPSTQISNQMFILMNFRDFVSILHKVLIGIVFFLFRPEIRQWLLDSLKKFQSDKRDSVTPQMLDIRNEIDDSFPETDDGNLQFR